MWRRLLAVMSPPVNKRLKEVGWPVRTLASYWFDLDGVLQHAIGSTVAVLIAARVASGRRDIDVLAPVAVKTEFAGVVGGRHRHGVFVGCWIPHAAAMLVVTSLDRQSRRLRRLLRLLQRGAGRRTKRFLRPS